jgi:hypothetical protein
MKKLLFLVITLALCSLSLTINSNFLNAQFTNNIKISDTQGLTRAFKANINQQIKVVISCDGQRDESEVKLVNSENGIIKSANSATKKNSETEIVFNDISFGNWVIQLSNKTIKINNVEFR